MNMLLVILIAVAVVAAAICAWFLIPKIIDNRNFKKASEKRKIPLEVAKKHQAYQKRKSTPAKIAGGVAAISLVASIFVGCSGIAFAEDDGSGGDGQTTEQSDQSDESDDQSDESNDSESSDDAKESMNELYKTVDKITRSMDDEATDPYLEKWGDEVDRQSTNYKLPNGQMNDQARAQANGWAWGPTYGLTAATPEGRFAEWSKWSWTNPIYGVGFACFLDAHGFTNDGRNPWISDMIALTKLQGYQNIEHPEEGFWYYDEDTWRTTAKWQRYAACLEAVIEQLVIVEPSTTEYIVEHWPMDTGENNTRRIFMSTENPQNQNGMKLGFPDKFGPDGRGSVCFAFLVDDVDGRLEVPGDQPTVITPGVEYTPGGGQPPVTPNPNPNPNPTPNPEPEEDCESPTPEAVKNRNEGSKDKVGAFGNQPDDGSGEQTTEHDATATGGSSDAGSNDGSGKSSNQPQNPGANQDNSTPPTIPDSGIVDGGTSAHDDTGQNVDNSTYSGAVDPD